MPGVDQALAAALLVGAVVALLSGLVRATIGRGRTGLAAALLDGALVASVAAVLVATMSPVELLFRPDAAPPEVNLQPFDRLDGAPPRFAVINVLLLAPSVLLLAQRWRRAGIVRLTLVALAASVAIELVQLWHPQRGTNVDDVALNTLGGAVAAVVGVALRRLRGAHVPRRGVTGGRRPLEAEVALRDQHRAVQRTG